MLYAYTVFCLQVSPCFLSTLLTLLVVLSSGATVWAEVDDGLGRITLDLAR